MFHFVPPRQPLFLWQEIYYFSSSWNSIVFSGLLFHHCQKGHVVHVRIITIFVWFPMRWPWCDLNLIGKLSRHLRNIAKGSLFQDIFFSCILVKLKLDCICNLLLKEKKRSKQFLEKVNLDRIDIFQKWQTRSFKLNFI